MSLASLPARHLLPLALGAAALSSCVCEREVFNVIPDAGPPDAAVAQQDAGPPPPEFPLKAGDLVRYGTVGVTYCNESFSTNCTEHSSTWSMEFKVEAPGPQLDPGSNAWVVPAEYFWQIAEKKSPDATTYQTLSKLWMTDFGPWEAEAGASDSEVNQYITTDVMLKGGNPLSFPFFDVDSRFDTAAQAFETYIRTLDAEPFIQVQKAARKFSAGYLEPGDPTQLHFISVVYHRLGFVCLVNESIGPWDPARTKNESGFSNNQRDFKTLWQYTQLTRAGGSPQFCRCGTGAGSDCE
ncbi:MAG: hypothetical protein AB2A00_08780 [Myxococcota bacterium]